MYQNKHLLILRKPPKIHFDRLLPEEGEWKPLHRLDFETSGCLAFARPEHWDAYHRLFKDGASRDSLKKVYLAGASADGGPWKKGSKIEGWITSRYRSSKKVQFFGGKDEERFRTARNRVEAHHLVEGPLGEEDPRTELARRLGFHGKVFEIELLTGARHQIRAFFAAAGAPLVGDPVYGRKTAENELMELHAWKLEIKDPLTGEWARAEAAQR